MQLLWTAEVLVLVNMEVNICFVWSVVCVVCGVSGVWCVVRVLAVNF